MIGATLVAAALVAPTPASAYYSGIGFQSLDPIVMTGAEGEPLPEFPSPKDSAEQICNVSGKTATRVNANVSTVAGADEDKPATPLYTASVTRIKPSNPKDEIKQPGWIAGECRSLELTPVEGAKFPDAPVTLTLTVTSSIGVARRAVKLDHKLPTEIAASAAVDPIPLTAFRDPLHIDDEAKLPEDQVLLLKSPPEGKTLIVPCEVADSEEAVAKPCFVGNLFFKGDAASVEIPAGQTFVQQSPSPVTLKVSLQGADKIGVYKGALDLANTPTDPKDDVNVEVAVTNHWGWAVGALVLSILIGGITQCASRRRTPIKRVTDRIESIEQRYVEAISGFNRSRPEFGGQALKAWPTPDDDAFAPIAIGLHDALTRLKRSTFLIDTKGAHYGEIQKALATIDDDIDCIADQTRLSDAQKSLAADLDGLVDFLNEHRYFFQDEPALAKTWGSLLDPPEPFVVGGAVASVVAIEGARKACAEWKKMATELVGEVRWYLACTHKATSAAPWPAADRERLLVAHSALLEARYELLHSTDLARDTPRADLARAYRELADVAWKHNTTPDDPAGLVVLELDDLEWRAFAETARHGIQRTEEVALFKASGLLGFGGLQTVGNWTAQGFGPVINPLLAFLPVLLATAGALATGVVAVYTDAPWGTFMDYVKVIVIGAAGQTALTAILDALTQLLPDPPKTVLKGPVAELVPAEGAKKAD